MARIIDLDKVRAGVAVPGEAEPAPGVPVEPGNDAPCGIDWVCNGPNDGICTIDHVCGGPDQYCVLIDLACGS